MVLPLQLWPPSISVWLHDLNRAILVAWTGEFGIKVIAMGVGNYFKTNKADAVVVAILWIVTFKAAADTYFPVQAVRNVTKHLDVLNAFQFLRVLRINHLLKRSHRLRNLMITLVISIPQAQNISIILLLCFYIFGVLGMKTYGGACSRPGVVSAEQYNYDLCSHMDQHNNFDSIGKAMQILFQVATGQDTSGIMSDLTINSNGNVVFGFFLTFYVFSNLVLLNLFVAVLMENFEQNIEDKTFAIREGDIEDFRRQWYKYGHRGASDFKIEVSALHAFVSELTGCLALYRDFDPHWCVTR